MAKKNEIVSWEAKEYIPREKNTGWYVGLVIVCLALVALSIFLNSWTFAILVKNADNFLPIIQKLRFDVMLKQQGRL